MQEKAFTTTNTQIGILKSRGVTITNKHYAKTLLRNTNYYNLINGYKDPFLLQKEPYELYKSGTTIEEIYALYEFDRQLRILTLEYILLIEKKIKSVVSYIFSKHYGHKDYLRTENFDNTTSSKINNINNTIFNFQTAFNYNKSKESSIKHYRKKKYVPLWVLVNVVSFNDISKFYSNLKQSERDLVAKAIKWNVRENDLRSFLFFLSTIRNRCAHDERLYTYTSYAYLYYDEYFKYFKKQPNECCNYFAVIVAFKRLLSIDDFNEYMNRLSSLFLDLDHILKTISAKEIQAIMGLPDSWRKMKRMSI